MHGFGPHLPKKNLPLSLNLRAVPLPLKVKKQGPRVDIANSGATRTNQGSEMREGACEAMQSGEGAQVRSREDSPSSSDGDNVDLLCIFLVVPSPNSCIKMLATS